MRPTTLKSTVSYPIQRFQYSQIPLMEITLWTRLICPKENLPSVLKMLDGESMQWVKKPAAINLKLPRQFISSVVFQK